MQVKLFTIKTSGGNVLVYRQEDFGYTDFYFAIRYFDDLGKEVSKLVCKEEPYGIVWETVKHTVFQAPAWLYGETLDELLEAITNDICLREYVVLDEIWG